MTQRHGDPDRCADAVLERLGGRVRLGLPLGLGKPVLLANALYQRARQNPGIELTIFTALTLERPQPQSDFEARLMAPLLERLFRGVAELDYVRDLRRGTLPANVVVEEFYLRPGAWLGHPVAQRHYVSSNYTHAARDLVHRGVNVVAQMVAPPEPGTDAAAGCLSLACNPDLTGDLLDAAAAAGTGRPLLVGEVNPALPYMSGGAELAEDAFDLVLAGDDIHYALFPVPRRAASLADQVIGARVAALVPDSGTLQVGIGSLGDAVAYALGLRHRDNARFRDLAGALGLPRGAETAPFEAGLYGASEMFVEGLLHLRRQGVLRRTVDDGVYLHAGFFLGSEHFYRALRELPAEERRGIDMTRISFINHLYGDEASKRRQRRRARFVNTAMKVTLLGAVVSDALEDGRVVSGVGGQYNFVAMAHELADARSVIVVPATRTSGGKLTSNIVWDYGHVTIPRHLRDLVVTEYGVADLRGATDQEVVAALLNVADSRFQEPLRRRAVAAGKLPKDYRIPPAHRNNRPERLHAALREAGVLDVLPHYPLGADFTADEAALVVALEALKRRGGKLPAMLKLARRGWRCAADPALRSPLERMGLARPRGLRERVRRLLVAGALGELHAEGRPLLPHPGETAGP
ncbi:MAG: acetyl-CoA hydrolase/transferase C-terminal domain-containing protein [Pseudomonadota bacterium]